MNENQTRTERNSKIQTIVLSIILPVAFLFSIFNAWGDITGVPFAIRLVARIILIIMPFLYYFIVMRERKDDMLLDSNKRRIILSLSVQAVTMLLVFVIPFGYIVFFTKPENGHWSGIEVILLLLAVICPLAIHLGGCLVRLIFCFIHKVTSKNLPHG